MLPAVKASLRVKPSLVIRLKSILFTPKWNRKFEGILSKTTLWGYSCYNDK